MKYGPINKKAYHLFHNGALELARAERNGMRVDVEKLKIAQADVASSLKALQQSLLSTKEGAQWARWASMSNKKLNLGNDHQARHIIYKVCGHKVKELTESGAPAVGETTLLRINTDFTRILHEWRKLDMVGGTFLPQIAREMTNGFIHPFFNLNLVITYRSSSDSPNWQNQPSRDPVQMKLVRDLLFARRGHQVGEDDLSGAEVCIAACYHKDPKMIEYINDPTKDMHRDSSCDCFMLKQSQVTKQIRSVGKGKFVFPNFYGAYWATVGPDLWDAITREKLVTADGIPLRDHLSDQGITSLGKVDSKGRPTPKSFLDHIRGVEDIFWNERFKVYTKWKKDWYAAYLKKGYFDTLTGFRCQGAMSRNDAINYPVQGSAFHCLLWSFTRLSKWLRHNKMDTRLIGQIHDSILKDYHPDEVQPVLKMTKQIMTQELPDFWKWIIVPIKAEYNIAPIDRPWSEKIEVKV